MRAAGLSAIFVLCPFIAYSQETGLERRALERARSIFESKTQKCGDAIFARMGPYAINEYKDVRYRIIASAEKNSGETVRVQALAAIRQYWANDGKWRSWAHSQVALDLNVTQDASGKLRVRPVTGADTSGEDLKPIACGQVPKPDPAEDGPGKVEP